jgi:long-chain acyl-CoA synthetase
VLLHEYLQRAARKYPDKRALICENVEYTYAEIARAAANVSRFLVTQGLKRGDRVVTYLDNSYDEVVAVFGILGAGGCVVPTGYVTPVPRVVHVVQHCGAAFLIAPHHKTEPIREALSAVGATVKKVWTGPAVSQPGEHLYQEILSAKHETPFVPPTLINLDLAAIIYTSGSTGKPKGVTHTHQTMDTAIESIVEYLDNGPDDVILCTLQLNFSYGLVQLLATFYTGGMLVLEKGFGYPYEVVKKFSHYRVTGYAGAPTTWAMLLQLKGVSSKDFETVRYITNAAAAIPEPFVKKLSELFVNARIFLMHGLTEVVRTAFLPPEEALLRPTSVGKAMRNVELWIEDDDGQRLGPGGAGEMIVRGPTLMAGYWNDPEATSRMMFPGDHPWERHLHTGDIFRMDERGYFYFVARKDEVIKSRGEKVSPVEVESVIYSLPAVAECRVIGIPDEILGNRIRAEIVLKPGQTLEEGAVKAECHAKLEPYKVPHDVVFLAQLPKTEGGKVIRRADTR